MFIISYVRVLQKVDVLLVWFLFDYVSLFQGQFHSTRLERITDNDVALFFLLVELNILGYKVLQALNFAVIKFLAYDISKTSLVLSCGFHKENNTLTQI